MRSLISIVLPIYNERENIERLFTELKTYHQKEFSDRFDLEVLFVDDGSVDGSTEILRRLAKDNDSVRVIAFSRNFGHQAAVSAGYRYSDGDAIVVMDSDLQHPVATIGEMVRQWQQGYDVVYAVRDSPQSGIFKRLWSRTFYRVFNWLSQTKIPPGASDFRLVTRDVVVALSQLPERCRFVRGLIPWLGFCSAKVTYTPGARGAGTPKYRFLHSLRLGITALTSFSVMPLRASLLLGVFFLLVSLGFLCYSLLAWLIGGTLVRGWTSIVALIILTQGLTLIAFGIQAEYLAKIVSEVKRRPEYIVRETVGKPARSNADRQGPKPPQGDITRSDEAESRQC